MHIVLTHIEFPLYWLPRIRVLNQVLGENGHELTVISATSKPTVYNFANVRSNIDNNLRWLNLFDDKDICLIPNKQITSALFQAFDKITPDIVIAVSIVFPPGAAAIRWSKMRAKPVIIMDDVRQVDVPRPWWINFIRKIVYQNVDAMLLPAPSHRKSYLDWGIPEDRIFYGEDVVDNHFFAENTEKNRKHVEDLSSRHDLKKPFFLGVGRQVFKKNWITLLKAFAAYRRSEQAKPWDLLLVGDGPEHKKLETYGIEHSIPGLHFRPFCDQYALCEYFSMSGAVILPSYYGETWGLIVNEAMAAGLPVIVSSACGCAQTLVREGANGWTFSPDNPHELSAILIKHSNLDETTQKKMGHKSQEIVSDWPLERFTKGLMEAVDACKESRNGFSSILAKLILLNWNGRIRLT